MSIRSMLPLLLLLACSTGPGHSFTEADQRAIRDAMAAQEAAWDGGDIPAFMAAYSDTICFIGPRGTTCGKDGVTANYLRSYPDATAMGDLDFGIHEVVPAGADHAWLTGTWQLRRTADTLGGGFSLLWAREAAGWRIVRDHTH